MSQVRSDFCDQIRETRAILACLASGTDELPVDDDNRGRLIGARSDYARTDDDIRQTLDHALLGLKAFDLPSPRHHPTPSAPLALGRHVDECRLAARRPRHPHLGSR
jgi:hypothetical protein